MSRNNRQFRNNNKLSVDPLQSVDRALRAAFALRPPEEMATLCGTVYTISRPAVIVQNAQET